MNKFINFIIKIISNNNNRNYLTDLKKKKDKCTGETTGGLNVKTFNCV